jgi:hypothetical protein
MPYQVAVQRDERGRYSFRCPACTRTHSYARPGTKQPPCGATVAVVEAGSATSPYHPPAGPNQGRREPRPPASTTGERS